MIVRSGAMDEADPAQASSSTAGAPPTVAGVEPAPEPLSRNRDFQTVLVGQGISAFGDAVTGTALPLLVLALTGSGAVMGVVGVLSTLPDLLIGLPAGAYADRWDRRRMMFLADLGRALLTAAIPLSILFGGPTLAVILLVTLPLNVLRVLWLAAYTAAVPGLVGRAQVGRATSVLEAVFNFGFILGPAIAGILSATIGPGPTIAIDAASFVVGAAALFLVRRPLRPEPRADRTHLIAEIREGVVYVIRHPTLRTVIGFWATTTVTTAALGTALTYHLMVDRALGAGSLGIVLSAYGLGSLGGALVAGRLATGRVGLVMLGGTLATGALLLTITLRPAIPFVVASAFLSGVAQANVLIGYVTLRTALSPDALLGRVGSTARMVSVGLMPLGALAGGLLVDATDGGATLAAMGGALVLASCGFALVPDVRRARAPGRAAAP